MSYAPPPLGRPPSYSLEHEGIPKHHGPDLGLILTIALLVAVVLFFVAVFVGAVTGSGS